MPPSPPNDVPSSRRIATTVESAGIRLEYGEASDAGLEPTKHVNLQSTFGHLFIVCDGMGGHDDGKQASMLAVDTVLQQFQTTPDYEAPLGALVGAVEEAARRVFDFGGPADNPHRPGSTLVSLLLHSGQVDTAHLGDSRAYAIRGQQIYPLTRDHSMVQSMLDEGVISEREAIGHPDGNKITRALGMTPNVEVEVQTEPMELFDGDIFVLATDGLTDLARSHDILVTVTAYTKQEGVQRAATELVALANRRGGHDNITVQVVRVLSAGPKSSKTVPDHPAGATPANHAGPLAPASARTIQGLGAGITGTGAPQSTVVQEPSFGGGPTPRSQSTAQPEKITPTIVDPTLRESGRSRETQVSDDYQRLKNRMSYLLLAMAGLIGLLLAVLAWALFFRDS